MMHFDESERQGGNIMETIFDRRAFCKTIGLAAGTLLGTPLTQAGPQRKLKIGHTSITWGFRPENAEPGIRESAKLGYHGYESLGEVLEAWEAKGGLGRVLDENNIPLPSTYFAVNLSDPKQRKGEVEKVIRWGKILKRLGGSVAVIGPNGVKRAEFDFNAAKPGIVASLNDIGKALNDLGLAAAVHQHTRTCIETREEVYAIMEAADSRYVTFGPDVAQLAAGGADPVKILKDFLPVITNVHLKDWVGGRHWSGYCPLGQGKVNIPAVMDVLENSKRLRYVMVELDPSREPPMTPLETAQASKAYLQKLGYTFRS
jgi:inosose dehydratase